MMILKLGILSCILLCLMMITAKVSLLTKFKEPKWFKIICGNVALISVISIIVCIIIAVIKYL